MKTKLFLHRQKLGVTQQYMADKLGIAVSAYNAYENGRKSCNNEIAEQIANIFAVDVNEIFLPSRFTVCEQKGS